MDYLNMIIWKDWIDYINKNLKIKSSVFNLPSINKKGSFLNVIPFDSILSFKGISITDSRELMAFIPKIWKNSELNASKIYREFIFELVFIEGRKPTMIYDCNDGESITYQALLLGKI